MPASQPSRLRLGDGRDLAYSELGDPAGYPVVWCHGGVSSRIDSAFAREGIDGLRLRLIAFDRPGIGESIRCKGRRVADVVDDVRALADDLGLGRFAVAGWSAGGPFALACGAALPDRVSAIATLGGMAPLRSGADTRELGLRVDRMMSRLARSAPWLAGAAFSAARRLKPERLKAMTLRSLPEPDRRALAPLPADDVVGSFYAAVAHGTGGTVDDYRAFSSDWGFELGAVQAPVRCWQGDGDTLVPMAHARRLAESLPSGELRIVQEAGHFLQLTHAREIFETLLADARAATMPG